MNNIDQNVLIGGNNNMTGLINNLGPARANMGVVEPVAVPVLPPPPYTVFCFNLGKIFFECC